MGQGILCQLNTIRSRYVHTTYQDDECRAGTNNQRICKYTKSLYQSLFYWMAHGSNSRRIWCTTLTSLIAEQTSLNTLNHSNTQHTSSSLTESESIFHDSQQYLWQTGYIPDDHTNGYQQIDYSHERDHGRREFCHTLDSTENDKQSECSENYTHSSRLKTEGLLPCQTDGITLYGIVGKTESDDHQNGKENSHPSLS